MLFCVFFCCFLYLFSVVVLPPLVGAGLGGVGLAGGGDRHAAQQPGDGGRRVGEPCYALHLLGKQMLGMVGMERKRGHLADDVLGDGEEAPGPDGEAPHALDGDGLGGRCKRPGV